MKKNCVETKQTQRAKMNINIIINFITNLYATKTKRLQTLKIKMIKPENKIDNQAISMV
jgi:hypothetical protein